jgi:lysine-ketoglutarate reductase/saccharopine dehydrogenase-like protein (TIGR00300 family)
MRPAARHFTASGHLIDSGLLTRALNLVLEAGGDYEVVSFVMGRTHTDESSIELEVRADSEADLAALAGRLVDLGLWDRSPAEVKLVAAPHDSCVPEDFYATTNRRTEVFREEAWSEVADMRMDGVIVVGPDGPRCRLIRDVRRGDRVVCTNRAVRIRPLFRDAEGEEFGFMASGVSSERSVSVAIRRVAGELKRQKAAGGRLIVVAGPVVVHTGGGPALASLVRAGYVGGLLAGNALAVHDIESVRYGTSLGIDLASGLPAREGHRNHLRAINEVFRHGSIAAAVAAGAIRSGIMYELVRAGVPYVLAGSLRDDGPLPEVEMDLLKAQARYDGLLRGASLVIMLSTMLHAIAAGNMLPAWVRTICVDINPAVVTKLADRGSGQAIGVVTDVGLFLRMLADELQTEPAHGRER